jgi:hypothetical protein
MQQNAKRFRVVIDTWANNQVRQVLQAIDKIAKHESVINQISGGM